jgi:hypothetical protein
MLPPLGSLLSLVHQMTFQSIYLLLVLVVAWGGEVGLYAGSYVDAPSKDAEATVVVYNSNDPEARGLADFYCKARHINSKAFPGAIPAPKDF